MNEKNYKKRLDFQQKMISRQSEQLEDLKLQVEKLEQKLKEKDGIINYVQPMRIEMTENIKEYRKLKNEYRRIIDELKKMKERMNQEVYRGKWRLVRWLIR